MADNILDPLRSSGSKLKLVAIIEEPAVTEKMLTRIWRDPQPLPRDKAQRRALIGAHLCAATYGNYRIEGRFGLCERIR